MRALRIVLLVLLLPPISTCGDNAAEPAAPAPGAPGPDLVMIVIDTLRADYLPFYGHPDNTAPFLNQLADQSAVFENAYSTSSWTAPSTASLFTATYPPRHGVWQGFFAQRKEQKKQKNNKRRGADDETVTETLIDRLPDELTTLPQYLKAQGYRTFGYSTNMNIGAEMGFDNGFDRFERVDHADAYEVMDSVEAWHDEIRAAEKSFLYLHFMDVHGPYNQRAPWFEDHEDPLQRDISAYRSELRYLDAALAEMYKKFRWDQNTIVWVVSDHGEEFMDHGSQGHGFSLHQELMGALMMVHAPDLGVDPVRVTENVSLVDVLPTLADWLGFESPGDGRSLLPLVLSTGEATDLDGRLLFGHRQKRRGEDHLYAVVMGSYKLIYHAQAETARLYDRAADPTEQHDIAAEHPQLVKMLTEMARQHAAQPVVGDGQGTATTLTEEQWETLRQQGYIED